MEAITEKQASYLLSLVNQATGNSYRFLSQVKEGGLGRRANKVRGISKVEASGLIEEWKHRVESV